MYSTIQMATMTLNIIFLFMMYNRYDFDIPIFYCYSVYVMLDICLINETCILARESLWFVDIC